MDNLSVVLPILIRDPAWQLPMTECAIESLRTCAREPFKLVVVETGSRYFCKHAAVDVHVGVERDEWVSATHDINRGLAACDTRYTLYTGNDIFVRPDWDTALLECFARRPDCGIATLATADLLGTPAGVYAGMQHISESFSGPFMCFETGHEFDAVRFPGPFADADLCMRFYEGGKRSYRNNRVVIEHLNRQTTGRGQSHANAFEAAKRAFVERWSKSPLLVARALCEGWIF